MLREVRQIDAGDQGKKWYSTDYEEDLRNIEFQFEDDEKDSRRYCITIMTGDTETSNGVAYKGKAVEYDADRYIEDEEYRKIIDENPKISVLYFWQWAILNSNGEKVGFVGRTLEELQRFLAALSAEVRRQSKFGQFYGSEYDLQYQYKQSEGRHVAIRCGFHNFSFDFAVLENIHLADFGKHGKYGGNTFARSSRRPMKAVAHVDNMRIEYFDTYVLVNRSLANWAKDEELVCQKIKKEESWYHKIRTPITELDEHDEIEYALYDVFTMIEGLKKFAERYGNIRHVPLTQTGCVRRQCWEALKDCVDYRRRCVMIQQQYSYKFFKKLCRLFTGGWTHANINYVNRVIDEEYGKIICHDFSSSYPFVCTTLTFPTGDFKQEDVSKFWEYEKTTGRDLWQIDHRWFAEIVVTDVHSTKQNSFFSLSKCIEQPPLKGLDVDNGRIRKAKSLHILVSDFDWDIFKQAYSYKGIEIKELWNSPAELFPKQLILLILKSYGEKTSFKDVEGKESLYKTSKIFVNAIFGLLCTKLIGEICELYDHKEITTEDKKGRKKTAIYTWFTDRDEEHIEQHFNKTMQNLKEERMVGVYPAGIWTCKAAMWNLWQFILKFDRHCIYCDTDSLKGNLDESEIEEIAKYNEWAKEIADKTAAKLGFDPALYAPKTPKGKEKRLGIFDREHDCIRFATKGAKRYYCEFEAEDKEGHKFIDHETTIAGLPKEAGKKKITSCEQFLDEEYTVFNVKESMKQTAYYNDEQPEVDWTDEQGRVYHSKQKFGCCILPTSFDLSMDEDFAELAELIQTGQTERAIFNDTALCLISDSCI